ncbi:MAG: hypothetical protein ACP5XB_10940, partial [Isosphaeraceae bacterium]
PLLTFDGDAVDASIDLAVNTVRMFHRTKIIVPREQGPPEMSIDVPEVSLTHLEHTVHNWPLGQTLLITGGIHPGLLDKKGGWLGTPFGAPTSSEVLVFLDTETVSQSRSSRATASSVRPARTDSRASRANADDPGYDDQSHARSRRGRKSTRGPDLESETDPEGGEN